jgi:hypothetical protein
MVLQLSEADAVTLATTLRGMATTITTTLTKKLQGQISRENISLDKSGHEVQAEAMQLALLMKGMPPTDAARRELLQAIRRWEASPQVASFLQVSSTRC